MSIETFDALLAKVEDRIQKQTTNCRQLISPEERPVDTISSIMDNKTENHFYLFIVIKSTKYNSSVVLYRTKKNNFDKMKSKY
jgi:hypothetical protein